MSTTKLTDICRPKQWKTISAKSLKKSGFPVYGANGKIGFYDKFTHEHPTVLITCRGATCGTINISEPKSYVNGNAMALDNLSKDYSLKFLYYMLKARGLNDAISGSAQPQITRTNLSNIELPNPPLKQQKQIASILDQADRLVQLNKELTKKYDELAQSIFLDMFGDPITNEVKWPKRKLKEFGNWKSGGTPSRKIKEYYDGEIPWVSSGELNDIYINKTKEHITKEAISKSSAHLIEKNSLLLGMYDTAALKSSINLVELSCNQAIAFSKLSTSINTIFVYYQIQFAKEFFRKGRRGIRQKNMNLSMIKNMELIYPPLELQNEFQKKINNNLAQKDLVSKSQELNQNLFQALLKKAFKGKLIKSKEYETA